MEAQLKQLIADFQTKALAAAAPVVAEMKAAQNAADDARAREAAARAEAETLRTTLEEVKATLTRLENETRPRALFEMKPDFDPAKHLSKDAQKLYAAVWEYIDAEYRKTAAKIIAGIYPYTNTPFPKGVIHDQSMRTIQQLSHAVLFVLERWGDPRAVKLLDDMWAKLLVPARLTDRFPDDIERKDLGHLEQPGTLRFIYWGEKGNPDESIANSDLIHLETSLISGQLQENSYALSQNIKHGFTKGYKALNWYLPHLRARLEFLGAKLYSSKPWWYIGSTLRHPAESRFAYHYFRWLEHADPVDKTAWEQIGKWLAEDVYYYVINGREYASYPHTVQGWAKARGNKPPPAAQDITYTRESNPHELLSTLAGSPWHSARAVAATARTMHDICMIDGPKSGKIAASIAGSGPASDNNQRVISFGGTTMPVAWMQTRADRSEHALQFTRGLGLVGTAFALDCPEHKQNLYDQMTLPDVAESGRWGHRIGLNDV